MKRFLALSVAALAFAASPAAATTITYSLTMDGAQEVPGPGDPDGSATGTLTIDDSTGGVGTISWSFTYANIATPLSAMHIHGPAAPPGTAAGVFVGLGVATSGGAGTLISSVVTTMANAAAINANPGDFYVNIHNGPFPSGAVRGQLGTVLPEPATLGLLAVGIVGLVWTGRRRA